MNVCSRPKRLPSVAREEIVRRGEFFIFLAIIAVFVSLAGVAVAIYGLLRQERPIVNGGITTIVIGASAVVLLLNAPFRKHR
ncbi:hypothetical protein ABW99_12345 [Pandoraea thiooxydans]|nr:hypothetical protein ABW99_12345 [Pandoraea thiooxydans]